MRLYHSSNDVCINLCNPISQILYVKICKYMRGKVESTPVVTKVMPVLTGLIRLMQGPKCRHKLPQFKEKNMPLKLNVFINCISGMIFMDDVEVPAENMLPNVKGFKVI